MYKITRFAKCRHNRAQHAATIQYGRLDLFSILQFMLFRGSLLGTLIRDRPVLLHRMPSRQGPDRYPAAEFRRSKGIPLQESKPLWWIQKPGLGAGPTCKRDSFVRGAVIAPERNTSSGGWTRICGSTGRYLCHTMVATPRVARLVKASRPEIV